MALRIVHPEEGWNQGSKRSFAIFFDQHRTPDFPDGRPWGGQVEAPANPKHNKGIVGELLPITETLVLPDGITVPGWDAPWLPEAGYITASIGSISGNRFKINYQRMIADYVAANERYYALVAEEAGARNLRAPNMYGEVPFQLRALKGVGAPPKSPKLPEAAAAGDPWLLGFSSQVNEVLADIIAKDNGRMRNAPGYLPETAEAVNSFAGLSQDDIQELAALLKANRQTKTMRDAKAAKRTIPSDDASAA